MRLLGLLGVSCLVACASQPAPLPPMVISPAPDLSRPMLPYPGPYDATSSDAHLIYEQVLRHFADTVLARDALRDPNNPAAPVRVDPRIGRVDPGTVRLAQPLAGRHDAAWLKSLEGRFRVTGSCEPPGDDAFCPGGVVVVLAPTRRADWGAAEVEVFAFKRDGERVVYSSRLYTLWREPAGWRVTGVQVRLTS